MTTPPTVPSTIEALAARLDVAPAAVARAIIAAHLTTPPSAWRASDNPQSPPRATGATLFASQQVQPLGPTDGRASSPASDGSTAGILEDIANDLIDDVLDDDGGFDVFEGASHQ